MLEDFRNPTSSRRRDRAWRSTIYRNAGCSKKALREAKKRGWPNHTTFPLRGLGRAARETVRGSFRVRDSTSGQAQKPIQSAFGWETGGRPERPKTPIQNEFGWGMGLDGNGWASRGAVTILRDTSLSSLCVVLQICRMTIRHGAALVVRHLPVARMLPVGGWRPASFVGARRLSSASSALPSIAPLAVSLSLTHTSWFCLPEQGMTHPEYLCAGTAFLTPLPPPRPPKAASGSGSGRGHPPSAALADRPRRGRAPRGRTSAKDMAAAGGCGAGRHVSPAARPPPAAVAARPPGEIGRAHV